VKPNRSGPTGFPARWASPAQPNLREDLCNDRTDGTCDLTMQHMTNEHDNPAACPIPAAPDLSGLTVVELSPQARLPDYRAAMQIANAEAEERLGQHMLLS